MGFKELSKIGIQYILFLFIPFLLIFLSDYSFAIRPVEVKALGHLSENHDILTCNEILKGQDSERYDDQKVNNTIYTTSEDIVGYENYNSQEKEGLMLGEESLLFAADYSNKALNPNGWEDLEIGVNADYKSINIKETAARFVTPPDFPSFRLTINQGLNVFYFPYIAEYTIMFPSHQIIDTIYIYNPVSQIWEIDYVDLEQQMKDFVINSNAFNALYTTDQGVLTVDTLESLRDEPRYPVIRLEGFIELDYYQEENPDPINFLDTNLIDPNRFGSDVKISDALKMPCTSGSNASCVSIEMIAGQKERSGRWQSTYWFFNRPSESERFFDPFTFYIIRKRLEE